MLGIGAGSSTAHCWTRAESGACVTLLQAYDDLAAKLRELDALNGINGLLGWDELVSILPAGDKATEQQATMHLISPAAVQYGQ